MTVSSQTSRVDYAGDGVTTIFPVPFYFLEDSHLKVILSDDSTGAETVLVLNTGYTVTGAGVLAGGSITATTEPSVGFTLTILRSVPVTQETDYVPNDPFPAESHERALDKLTMIAQQTTTDISGAIRVAESDPEPSRLPPAASRALRLMGFDASGNPVAVVAEADSAAELALDLRNDVDPAKGSAMIGHEGTTVRAELLSQDARLDALEPAVVTLESEVDALQLQTKYLDEYSTKGHTSVNGFLISQNPWGVRCVNILGDSISFGANAQDIERDSWVGIFKKMMNIETGTDNVGVLNIISQSSNSEGTYLQYFSVAASQTGTWLSIVGASAAHIPFGFALESSVALSTQNLKAPLSQRYMRVWYDGTVTGEIEVVIGGVVQQTITTTGAGTGYDRGAVLDLTTIQAGLAAGNQGTVTFTLRNKSGTIRLTGLEFTNDTTGNSLRVHNFSRDGRAGQFVGQDVINQASAGAYAFIWALGTNDITGYDASAQAAYDLRIDWIIAAAATNRTKVVFIDFLYNQPYTHGLRASLRRGAESIPGAILIDVEQAWTVSGAQYSEAERIQRNLSFGVHPEEIGHRIVAETLAQRLGLQCTSKKQAVLSDPIWKVLDISASTFKNRLNVAGQMCSYRVGPRGIDITMDLLTVPGVQTTIAQIPTADFPGIAGYNYASNPDATGKFGLWTIASNGNIVYRPNPESSGAPSVAQLNITIPYRESLNWP